MGEAERGWFVFLNSSTRVLTQNKQDVSRACFHCWNDREHIRLKFDRFSTEIHPVIHYF